MFSLCSSDSPIGAKRTIPPVSSSPSIHLVPFIEQLLNVLSVQQHTSLPQENMQVQAPFILRVNNLSQCKCQNTV